MLNLINRVYDIHYTGMYMYKNQQGKTSFLRILYYFKPNKANFQFDETECSV